AVRSVFTIQRVLTNEDIDPRLIYIIEPDAQGLAAIHGAAGSVPASTLVFAENVSRLASTTSVTSSQSGSFDLEIEAQVTDTILLHVLIEGSNEIVLELTPFMTSDRRGAHVDADASEFVTADGILVGVAEGTFEGSAVVTLVPQTPGGGSPIPAVFNPVLAFNVSFGGATAHKALDVRLPAPPGSTESTYFLARQVELFGDLRWMVNDQVQLIGGEFSTVEGSLAVAESGSSAVGQSSLSGAVQVEVESGLVGEATAEAAAEEGPSDSPGTVVSVAMPAGGNIVSVAEATGQSGYLPGMAFPGQYEIWQTDEPVGFIGVPLIAGLEFAIDNQLLGIVAVIDRATSILLRNSGVWIPALLGQSVSLEARDLTTGYRVFEGLFDPPPSEGGVQQLPPSIFEDTRPLYPIGGSPLRFLLIDGVEADDQLLEVGIRYDLHEGSLVVTGDSNATDPGSSISLVDIDGAGPSVSTLSGASGDFTIYATIQAEHRYVLALGADVGPNEALEIRFNEGLMLPSDVAVHVPGSTPDSTVPVVTREEVFDNGRGVRILPEYGWATGQSYRLVLPESLKDAQGNAWGRRVVLPFSVRETEVLSSLSLDGVKDMARLGSLVFVAAEHDGLVVVDGRDPSDLKNFLPEGPAGQVGFELPFRDQVRGLTIDPHGRVLYVGGGNQSFGVLNILDPLMLVDDDGTSVRNPDAVRGTSIVSDLLNSNSGTQLPEGLPLGVSVVSNDEIDTWFVGEDPPSGLDVSPETIPEAGASFKLGVSGQSFAAGTPVTLRNLTRGTWHRVDSEPGQGFLVELEGVEIGDEIELLRNVDSFAFVNILGAGIGIVDVNQTYLETGVLSQVLDYYTGYGEPNLQVCGRPVSDFSGALIDLEVLPGHGPSEPPFTLVGVLGLNGVITLNVSMEDPTNISFLADQCLTFDEGRGVSSVEVVADHAFLTSTGQSVVSDWLIVSHREGGVIVLNAADRSSIQFLSRIRIPGEAAHSTFDRSSGLLYVGTTAGEVVIVDLTGRFDRGLVDLNDDGRDDRVLEVVEGIQGGNSPLLVVPELGLAYIGGVPAGVGEDGTSSLALGSTKMVTIARRLAGEEDVERHQELARLAPLGVPNVSKVEGDTSNLSAWFQALAFLPGAAGEELSLDVEAVGPGGVVVRGAGTDEPLPRVSLVGDDAVPLTRQSDVPWHDGYNIYRSEPMVAVADLRATRLFDRTEREDDQCVRCSRVEERVPEDSHEILSGDEIQLRLSPASRLAVGGEDSQFADAGTSIQSTRWEMSPSVRQEPTLNPSLGSGEVVPGLLLHSGEFSTSTTDLSIRGRSLGFAFTRTYRNQTLGRGPLGPGWDHEYNQRLRELPNGDVEYYDGRGRRELFKYEGEAVDAGSGTERRQYSSPPGRFASLDRNAEGFLLLDAHWNQARFDRHGRLVMIADSVKDSEDTGTELEFFYDAQSHLVRVSSNGRQVAISYNDSGLIKSVSDHDGRTVRYNYDSLDRLQSVVSPTVTSGLFSGGGQLTTGYAYEEQGGSLASRLHGTDDLNRITDARGLSVLNLLYDDQDGDGHANEVSGGQWGAEPFTVGLVFSGDDANSHAETTVVDRRGNSWVYEHNSRGHVEISHAPGLDQPTVFEVAPSGQILRTTFPSGREIETKFDSSGTDPRAMGNVTDQIRHASDESDPLTIQILEYDNESNSPSLSVDERGTRTFTQYKLPENGDNYRGRPRSISRDQGGPAESNTLFEYNRFGQITSIRDPRGRWTTYEYFEDGVGKGYLRSMVRDVDGIAQSTTFETDARGNVTKVTDPRGGAHEFDYNELDWLVSERLGIGPGGGAPLSVSTYLYDRVGNLKRLSQASGDGANTTLTEYDYGTLGEVLEVRREGFEASSIETFEYDAALNLLEKSGADGQLTTWTYDERSLPATRTLGADSGNETTEHYTFDKDGNLKSRIDGRGQEWWIHYDGHGRQIAEIDPLGNRLETKYHVPEGKVDTIVKGVSEGILAYTTTVLDPLGRTERVVERLWPPQAVGMVLEELPEDVVEVVTSSVYDPSGNLLEVHDPNGAISTWSYDGLNRVQEAADAKGNRTVFEYDQGDNVLVQNSYETLPFGGTAHTVLSFEYDALGRPTLSRDGLGREQGFQYDFLGNVTLETDPEGFETSHSFDGFGRRRSTLRPDGSQVTYQYDGSSRLRYLVDHLGNSTEWQYDALDRVAFTFYADGTSETFEYDENGNLVFQVDGRGTAVTLGYDEANRLTSKSIAPSVGVLGPTIEHYDYDGMGRVLSASSGPVYSSLAYDSLSRLVEETTAGRSVGYGYDPAGNRIRQIYPSGLVVGTPSDELGRPTSVLWGPGLTDEVKATFGYRGTDLVGSGTLGEFLEANRVYDDARQLVDVTMRGASAAVPPVHSEALAWHPRGLLERTTSSSRNHSGLSFGYDPAGRLESTTRVKGSDGPVPASISGLPDSFGFQYDGAENLLSRTQAMACSEDMVTMPLDASGRNRPSSVGGQTLSWDAAGNMVRRGGEYFFYDYRNRLTRITDGPDLEQAITLAQYEYDAFDRRVAKEVAGVRTETVWADWQPIEEYLGANLSSRRTYGLGLDEIVALELDVTGNGLIDGEFIPIYDIVGNVAMVTMPDGTPVERYEYSPYGERWVIVDSTAPEIEQVRVVGTEVWVELSEEVLLDPIRDAINASLVTLTWLSEGHELPLAVAQPVSMGPEAGRRLVFTPTSDPSSWPMPGDSVEFRLQAEVLFDTFGNESSSGVTQVFPWFAGSSVLEDDADPRLDQACVLMDGRVELVFSEALDASNLAGEISVGGQSVSWTAAADNYTLTTTEPLAAGSYSLAIGTGPLDLVGRGLGAPFQETIEVIEGARELVYLRPADGVLTASTIGNSFGFHGLSRDLESGLYYARHRYFDPGMGRFVTSDPLGYVDGPNLYQYGLNDPVNYSDPTGEFVGTA
ncbi:MAG: DUF6531 domain-containing protein, partial [Thermoanaerobaculia bacterium]|nr:DUF6531 domain-containing protein [Thermoanaerobaculia bacterium]